MRHMFINGHKFLVTWIYVLQHSKDIMIEAIQYIFTYILFFRCCVYTRTSFLYAFILILFFSFLQIVRSSLHFDSDAFFIIFLRFDLVDDENYYSCLDHTRFYLACEQMCISFSAPFFFSLDYRFLLVLNEYSSCE
jgi:hypothetical protein